MPPMRDGVLSVDAPVTLDELLDRTARETLHLGARDLGVPLAIVDRDGGFLVGAATDETRSVLERATDDLDPVTVEILGRRWVVASLMHEGSTIGRVLLGPFPDGTSGDTARRVASHLVRVSDAFLLEGMRRAMSARMHMATVEEANRELTEKNRRLAQAVERLQEADRVKSNFLATVSHELRTPLTSVIGYSEMLLEGIAGELNEEQREYVRTVMEKGEQLLQLITGILDISRIEANEMKFERAAFSIEQVLQIALSTITPVARRKHLRVASHIAPGIPQAMGDRDKIRQVLLNLLNNAVKFTPESGTVEIRVDVGPLAVPSMLAPKSEDGTTPNGIRVAVEDSGIGISPEHHRRIFDPFYQVDSSSTREFGGTGLGLHIVRKFVEGQGGVVWVESHEGHGATFAFTLPLAPAPAPTP
jgi:two-component system sensor histidine kinase BarA